MSDQPRPEPLRLPIPLPKALRVELAKELDRDSRRADKVLRRFSWQSAREKP